MPRARLLADPNREHHGRAHALASADAIMACLKSGLDQRFFLMLKFEYAGVDLSHAVPAGHLLPLKTVVFGYAARLGKTYIDMDMAHPRSDVRARDVDPAAEPYSE